MKVSLKSVAILFFISVAAFAQNLSIANQNTPPSGGYAPGATVPLAISKSGNPGAAALQFDLAISAGGGTITVAPGPAMPATKNLQCSTVAPLRCLIAGFNTAAIPDGVLAIATVQIAATVTSSPVTATISKPVESDANGVAIPTVIGNPTVSLSIRSGCDVDGDGSVSSADFSAVASAITSQAASGPDLNKDGSTNAQDAQIVATAGTPPAFTCNAK